MAKLPGPLPIPAVKSSMFQEILAAKQARRRRLASLPIDQKVDLIEQLREFGRTMLAARESFPKRAARPESR